MTKETEDQRRSKSKLSGASTKNDAAVSVSNRAIDRARFNEIASLLWRHRDLTQDEIDMRVATAVDFLECLRPRSGADIMLAHQMVATHYAVIDCLRLAAREDRSIDARTRHLSQAYKLMSLFVRQVGVGKASLAETDADNRQDWAKQIQKGNEQVERYYREQAAKRNDGPSADGSGDAD